MAPAAPAEAASYSYRSGLFSGETTYRLDADALDWTGGSRGHLPLADIRRIRLYNVPGANLVFGGATVVPPARRCVIRAAHRRAIVLSSSHAAGLGKFEDRSASFRLFLEALAARVVARNPEAVFVIGMPRLLWLVWLAIFGANALLVVAGLMVVGAVLSTPALHNRWWDFGDAVLVLIAGFAGLAGIWRILRRGRPRRFFPSPADAASV